MQDLPQRATQEAQFDEAGWELMANRGFFCLDGYLNRTAKLTDEELGRLFRACMVYHATGEVTDLEGRESVAFDFIREDIDAANEAYTAKCETNRRNRLTALADRNEPPLTNDNDRQRTSTNVHNININTNTNTNKNKQNIDAYMCSEGDTPSEPEPEPPVFQIVLNNKTFHPVTQKDIDRYKELYPAVNIEQEMRKIVGWCEANPTKRKTKTGVQRFINSWLSREQDRGGSKQAPVVQAPRKIVTETLYDQRPNTENSMDDVPEWLIQYKQEHQAQGGNAS